MTTSVRKAGGKEMTNTDRSQSLIQLVASIFRKVKWCVRLVPLVKEESLHVKSQEWTGGWSRFMGYRVRSHRAVQDIVPPHRTFPYKNELSSYIQTARNREE